MTKPLMPNDPSRAGGQKYPTRPGQIPLWLEQAQHAHSGDARNAWSLLLKIGRHDKTGRKLTVEERTQIAQRLHRYYEEKKSLLDKKGFTIGHLCDMAFGPDNAKEWYRITLPEGVDAAARGTRANGWKYAQMVKALSCALGDSREQVADRLLKDTKLDPFCRSLPELTEIERVQSSLGQIVTRIDSEFGLFATYQRTAELKRMAIEAGSTQCWPLYDLEMSENEEPLLSFETAIDPSQAYYRLKAWHGSRDVHYPWLNHWHDCGQLQNDDFFYVPHAPLGHALIWDLPFRRNDPAGYGLAVHQQLQAMRSNPENLKLPEDGWDDGIQRPRGQTASPDDRSACLQYHFWLLAYPHPDGRGVVPTLFQAGEEGGTCIRALDANAMEMLCDAVWVSPQSHESMLDRLLRLLTDGDADQDECSIERSLKRTAPWLGHNPVLKQHQAQLDRSRALERYLRRP